MSESETVDTAIQGFHWIHAVYLVGLVLMGSWVLRTRWGVRALRDTRERRNVMHPLVPLGMFFLWFLVTGGAAGVADYLFSQAPEWRLALYRNCAYLVMATLITGLILVLGWVYFARRLKGFGLNWRTIPRDMGYAVVYLLAVWPVLVVSTIVTPEIARLFFGPNFKMPQHEQLELLETHPELALHLSIFLVAAVTAPILEELLFRGLFQTMLRKQLRNGWAAIIITSVFFASVHPNMSHWPTLFILGMCLGYSYEKSGSLFRPIFIHTLFNGISVVSVLMETAPQ